MLTDFSTADFCLSHLRIILDMPAVVRAEEEKTPGAVAGRTDES